MAERGVDPQPEPWRPHRGSGIDGPAQVPLFRRPRITASVAAACPRPDARLQQVELALEPPLFACEQVIDDVDDEQRITVGALVQLVGETSRRTFCYATSGLPGG